MLRAYLNNRLPLSWRFVPVEALRRHIRSFTFDCSCLKLPKNWALAGYSQALASSALKVHFMPVLEGNCLLLKVVGWLGLEPRTNGLKGRCSTD
jgi:hypothetical protein